MRKLYICIVISAIIISVCVVMGVMSIKRYAHDGSDDEVTTEDTFTQEESETSMTIADESESRPEPVSYPGSTLLLPGGYDAGSVASYFLTTAFGTELGSGSEFICKWNAPLLYNIYGTPDAADMASISYICSVMNSVPGFPGISQAASADEANLDVYFGSYDLISQNIDLTNTDFNGISSYFWQKDTCRIVSGAVGIVNDGTSDALRRRVIMEEFMQVAGLGSDSYDHSESLFYQDSGIISSVPDIDLTLFRLLYSDSMAAGTDKTDAYNIVLAELGVGPDGNTQAQ